MKYFLSLFISFSILSAMYAQPGGSSMEARRPAADKMQENRARPVGSPGGQITNAPSGNFFSAELKDGSIITGNGTLKFKNNLSVLELKTPEGKEHSFTPSQLKKLSRNAPGGIVQFVNFDNKYWLCLLNKNVDRFYQVEGDDEMLFIKEKDTFRIVTKEDMTELVKENKDAYKQARKGHIKKALLAYIGEPPPERNEFREMRENIDAGKVEQKQQLFNQ